MSYITILVGWGWRLCKLWGSCWKSLGEFGSQWWCSEKIQQQVWTKGESREWWQHAKVWWGCIAINFLLSFKNRNFATMLYLSKFLIEWGSNNHVRIHIKVSYWHCRTKTVRDALNRRASVYAERKKTMKFKSKPDRIDEEPGIVKSL